MTAILAVLAACAAGPGGEETLRVGLIGLDTSHVVAFTKILNDEKDPGHIPGARVVAAYRGGSPDVEASASRIDGFTKQLQERFGVRIVDSIEELCTLVDAVMLESVDGRPHLAQARPVLKAGRRLFIDKPMAGSTADGREIARLAKESGTPFFSASSVRFYATIGAAREAAGAVRGCDAFSPASREPHHPDLFWYGVHGVEALYSVMGPGCESVTRTETADQDVVVGRWKDGRIGTFRGLRHKGAGYGVTVFGDKGAKSSLALEGKNGYHALVGEVVKFFRTGEPPVSPEECVEVLAFMEAADLSKARGGAAVRLEEVK